MKRNRKAEILYSLELLNDTQLKAINEYRSRNFFSLFIELRIGLYLSVLFFTTGAGILVYENVGSIGHLIILSSIFILSSACFYYAVKYSANTLLHDNSVLAANILLGIFIAYLQFQYEFFGNAYGLATLIPTAICFFSAYYFNHRGVLSMAISGLAAFAGFSAEPLELMKSNYDDDPFIAYSIILVGVVLVAWIHISRKLKLKEHFEFTFLNFALHFIGIAALQNMWEDYWFAAFSILAISSVYFIKQAYSLRSVSFMIFSIIYAYLGLTFLLGRLLSGIESMIFLIYLTPIYIAASIYFFMSAIKSFKNKITL